jgi:hypothetical protein
MLTHIRSAVAPVLILSLFLLSGCATALIKVDQFTPSSPQAQKLPLKVALVVDKQSKAQPVSLNFQLYGVEVVPELEPGLSEAFKKELEGLFEEVVLVENAGQAKDKDLIVSVSAKLKESGMMALECRMEAIFRDAYSNTVVTRLERAESINTKPPASVGAFAFLTGLSLFLGAPIFLPLAAMSHSDKITEELHTAIPEIVRTIGKDVTFDRGITLMARKDPSMQQFAGGGAAERRVPASDVDAVPVVKPVAHKNHYAIVIGIERYREKLPKADYADRDAKLVGDYLVKVMGYPEENVIVRTNEKASLTDITKYFENWLPNNVEKDSSVFVYYSGHGAPNPRTGDAYMVPYDGDPTFVDATGYSMKRLYAALDKLQVRDVTVVLDSCFSGAGGRSVLAKGAKPMGLSVEHTLAASGRTTVLAASAGDQISSSYEEKGHGLLTYFFLKGLQGEGDLNKDGNIDMAELYEYVKPSVSRIARKQYNNEQTPQLLGSPDSLKRGSRLIERAAQ